MASISNFWQRIITGILFLVIMIGSILWSFESFMVLMGIISILACHEYIKVSSFIAQPHGWVLRFIGLGSYILAVLVVYLHIPELWLALLFLIPVIVCIGELFRGKEQPFRNIAFTLTGFFYVVFPFILLLATSFGNEDRYLPELILAYFLFIWINDSFAYVWGKLLGKHKLSPKISQGKTIEGSIGGILTTLILAFIYIHYIYPFPYFSGMNEFQFMLMAFLITLFSIPSDLSESLLKRQAGIKDSGKILPGHGGILDRFDSVFLTAPVFYVYHKLLILI